MIGRALLALSVGLTLTFLALPVVALFTEAPLADVPSLLRDPGVRAALAVTARTNAVANLLIIGFGTPTAWVLATRRFRGRALLLTLVELPLVLPPAVAGIGLLAAFGVGGLLGAPLEDAGIVLPFTEWAVVLAVTFVASPFYIRQAVAAFEAVDPELPEVARTLGASPARAFRRVTLPLALSGLVAGWVLAFARGVGEFGATIIFAGNVRGETQTLTLAVYEQLDLSLRRGAVDRDPARRPERRRAPVLQAVVVVADLSLRILSRLRAFAVDVDLTVAPGTLALVGPSGAGKTTVLRCRRRPAPAGRGTHRARRRGVVRRATAASTSRPSAARSGWSPSTTRSSRTSTSARTWASAGPGRVDDLLARLRIAHLAGARPGALSGGERQRVALARALAREPEVLLLDEPLAALDAHTRGVVRAELHDVLASLDLPALLVTHDFRDAAALADRIAVIHEGRIHQTGTPEELLSRPQDAFVASFTGANVLVGEARGAEVRLDDGTVVRLAQDAVGRVAIAVHPWALGVTLSPPPDGINAIPGRIESVASAGDRVRVRSAGLESELEPGAAQDLRRGLDAWVTFRAADAHVIELVEDSRV